MKFDNGEEIPAIVISSHDGADLAILELKRIPEKGLHVAVLGNSDQIRVGDQIFIVGTPKGLNQTLTVGYISARRKPHTEKAYWMPVELFQTDAAINNGNSGGPMFNMKGEIIGIVSYSVSNDGGDDGIGFGITSNAVRKLILEQESFCTGFHGKRLMEDMNKVLNVPQSTSILVEKVLEGSPADRLGLKGGTKWADIDGHEFIVGGDIILEVQGILAGADEYYENNWAELGWNKGIFRVKILRDGSEHILSAKDCEK